MIAKAITLKSFLSVKRDISGRPGNDAVMEKVDEKGNIIGFSILKVSALKEREPISVSPQ